jgi:carboxyl-terminal processing protease
MSPIGPRYGRLERPVRSSGASRRILRLISIVSASLAFVPSVRAQQNLSFEELDAAGVPRHWSIGGGDATTDAAVAVAGERTLRVTRATAEGVTRVTQRIAAASLRGREPQRLQRVRLAGFARVDSPAVASALWLRIDGPRGPLFVDSYGYGRESTEEPETVLVAGGGDSEWRRLEIELPLPDDVDEIAFGVSQRGRGTAWFDALELVSVATDSGPPAAPAAVRYVESALAIMRQHSLRQAEVDWGTVRERALAYARGAATAAESHLAVRFAVRELGDRHSYLQSPRVTRALQTAAVSNARTGAAPTAPRGRRLGRLAAIEVPGFAGGTPVEQVGFAEALKNIIQLNDVKEVCGWVVDLRQNSGGNLWPMLAGLGPLLGAGELAASVYPDGRRVGVWYRDGQAGFGDYTQLRVREPYGLRAPAPVAVLVGPGTASSAEVLAVAWRGRPGTRSFGAPTRGLSAGNRTFPLADGASLVLTVAATSDAAGRVLEGPLVPDERVTGPNAGGTRSDDDAPLAAAVAWLLAGDSCR